MTKRFGHARTKGRITETKMLLYKFAVHESVLHDTFELVRSGAGNNELCLEVRSPLIAFAYANVFRVYHR